MQRYSPVAQIITLPTGWRADALLDRGTFSLQSFLLNGAYRQGTSFQWKDKCSKPFLTFSLARHFIFQIKAHSDGSEPLTSDDVPRGGHAYSHATDRSNFCWIPSSSLAVQRQPSSVIKPTPHHASRNQTLFLSGWTDRSLLSFEVPNGFFLQLPIWLSDSLASWPSPAGSDQTHSAFFVFHLSVSGPLSPQRDAFIQPWQSMTTTAHCERGFSRNSSLNIEDSACIYSPRWCYKPCHFSLWNTKGEIWKNNSAIFQ